MKIAIVGSRDYPNAKAVISYVEGIHPYDTVVSGGARGVDTTAEQAARFCGLSVEVFPADWKKHGKAAGFIRNKEIVDFSDRVVAFWDGKSRGTLNTIEYARRAGKPVEIHSSSAESTRKCTAHGSSVVDQRPAQGGVGPRPGAEGRTGSASGRAGGDPSPTQPRLFK